MTLVILNRILPGKCFLSISDGACGKGIHMFLIELKILYQTLTDSSDTD
ncbi:hypothetical protein [Melioribacter roseus]|nr:hypothetical protein [Melioribacter roseus]